MSMQTMSHPHPVFTRRDDDLELTLNVSLLEERSQRFPNFFVDCGVGNLIRSMLQALVGFTRDLVHLDGRVVKLNRDEVVQPTTVWKISNEGMPRRNRTGEFGYLLVHFNIAYPTELDDASKSGKEHHEILHKMRPHLILLQPYASS
ncbi:unnamed protein product [Phytophthora lilii]|uniref:Unnamed protein product n=1 Tax=Phytophthora lilii TaxID=2077276 RepID=A0A9W6YK61_9STRA|nr:unnamed protein product [Phytophthora lilii]